MTALDLARRLPSPIRTPLARVADAVLPARRLRAATRQREAREHATAHAAREREAARRLELTRELGNQVLSGPFAGMTLTVESSWNHMGPYILGSYEEELHAAIEQVIALGPTTIVDIGAAEGYYAIGLARRLPDATVYASDVDPVSRRLCRENAERNGVSDRVVIFGALSPSRLGEILTGGGVLLMDCEGCELELLDPELVPQLTQTYVIVELHDFIDPTIRETVERRLARTHVLELVDVHERAISNYPHAAPEHFEWMASEDRPVVPHPMQWALCRPAPAVGTEP